MPKVRTNKLKKRTFHGNRYTNSKAHNDDGVVTAVINIRKPTYISLFDQVLLLKCLHGKTQNCNESFNHAIWTILPKETFAGLQTLLLGSNIAVLIFNSGYLGLLPVFENLGFIIKPEMIASYMFNRL